MFKDDRRMFKRFGVDFSTDLKQLGKKASSAQCCDASPRGVGLLGQEELIPHTKLELSLGIPNGHSPIRNSGRVVWSKQVRQNRWRAGVEFAKIDFMGTRRILRK